MTTIRDEDSSVLSWFGDEISTVADMIAGKEKPVVVVGLHAVHKRIPKEMLVGAGVSVPSPTLMLGRQNINTHCGEGSFQNDTTVSKSPTNVDLCILPLEHTEYRTLFKATSYLSSLLPFGLAGTRQLARSR